MAEGDHIGVVLLEKVKEIEKRCKALQDDCKDSDESELIGRACFLCNKCFTLLNSCSGHLKKPEIIQVIRDCTQALLDQTYVTECRLVNADFLEDICDKQLNELLGLLIHPFLLVEQVFGPLIKAGEVFGVELLECLYWRTGALLYMFCHEVYHDSDRLRRFNLTTLVKYAESGVSNLQRMLCVRAPVLSTDFVEFKDLNTSDLLLKGIFSDTHMLALMYAGELCLWHSQILERLPSTHASQLDSKATGKMLLLKYIEAVEGPLKGQGWNCDRAKELVEILNHSKDRSEHSEAIKTDPCLVEGES